MKVKERVAQVLDVVDADMPMDMKLRALTPLLVGAHWRVKSNLLLNKKFVRWAVDKGQHFIHAVSLCTCWRT